MSEGGTVETSAEDIIKKAAEAYLSGDVESFASCLHEEARVVGSEQRDVWSMREDVMTGMAPELARRESMKNGVSGSLIEHVRECAGVREFGDTALFSTTGDIELDTYYHRKASWSVMLARDESSGGEWKIVHSHFSIHR